jgi:hypothetical protein
MKIYASNLGVNSSLFLFSSVSCYNVMDVDWFRFLSAMVDTTRARAHATDLLLQAMRPLCPCKPRVHRRYARLSAFVSASPRVSSAISPSDNKHASSPSASVNDDNLQISCSTYKMAFHNSATRTTASLTGWFLCACA